MSELSDKIVSLRNQGYTYNRIVEELGCSKGTVAYWLGEGQKEKTSSRQKKNVATLSGGLQKKIHRFSDEYKVPKIAPAGQSDRAAKRLASDKVGEFQATKTDGVKIKRREFSVQDVIDRFGTETECYLTGTKISLDRPNSYEFDHVVPRSRGGSNKIDNLGIASPKANRAKGDMTLEEFLDLCEAVLRHHGRMGV